MEIPESLQNLLPGYAAYYKTDVGNLFWWPLLGGYPPEYEGMSRKLLARQIRIMDGRNVDDVRYNLFMKLDPPTPQPEDALASAGTDQPLNPPTPQPEDALANAGTDRPQS